MPRTKKAAGTTADRRNGRRAEVADSVALERFELPDDRPYGVRARAAWDAYWSSGVAEMALAEDAGLLLAWIDAYDRAERLFADADAEPVVVGHNGQPRPNALFTVADRERAAAAALARQLGIGPRNRADLGIALLNREKTLADLNATYGDEEAEDDDPRG